MALSCSDPATLLHINESVAKLFFAKLRDLPNIQQRAGELVRNLESLERELVQLKRSPKVSMHDACRNEPVMSAVIEADEDEHMKSVPTTQRTFQLIDDHWDGQLSCQKEEMFKQAWYRWERDKIRLVWAFSFGRRSGANSATT